jgi:hypothetical protein
LYLPAVRAILALALGRLRAYKIASYDFVEPTDGTLEFKKLLENWELLVPSEPLASPFVPVDSVASGQVRSGFFESPDLSFELK